MKQGAGARMNSAQRTTQAQTRDAQFEWGAQDENAASHTCRVTARLFHRDGAAMHKSYPTAFPAATGRHKQPARGYYSRARAHSSRRRSLLTSLLFTHDPIAHTVSVSWSKQWEGGVVQRVWWLVTEGGCGCVGYVHTPSVQQPRERAQV